MMCESATEVLVLEEDPVADDVRVFVTHGSRGVGEEESTTASGIVISERSGSERAAQEETQKGEFDHCDE